jgi:hypothetical protein
MAGPGASAPKRMDAMNKLVASAFLSLLGLGMAVQQAAAWGCHSCCLCCRCKVCISSSQYNAFSPFCVDNVSYRGCCGPLFFPNNNCCPSPSCDPCCTGSDCCDGGVLGQLPAPGAIQGAPAAPKSTQPAPGFKAPMPTPAGDGRTMGPMMQPYPQVYPVGMQPNYYPGY